VLGVADHLGKILKGYKVIVNKSTVPVGTVDKVIAAIAKNYSGEYDVVSNPEFLREGVAVDDFMKPDRVVVGTRSERAKKLMSDLYAPFVRQGNPVIFMDERSSELTKYAANSFLATKISFMNEVAQLCERMGADVDMVRRGIGSDERIGKRFLFPGIGYGGSCFPKDVKALIKTAYENGYHMGVLKAVEEVNDKQKSVLFDKVMRHFDGNIKGKTFGMWGLSFKPKTDDMREAPSLVIIEKLLAQGAIVKVHDPIAMKEAKHILGDKVIFCEQQEQAIASADALLVVTEWADYRAPDLTELKASLASPIIFDGRNIFDASEMREHGFTYYGIGIN
jgi:UDPglucose 6-dehydrogenase